MAILVVGGAEEGRVCADEWAAVVRREDVRATEKEKVVIGESFRVGDVVRGVVVCRLILISTVGLSEDEWSSEGILGDWHGKLEVLN